MLLDDIQVCSYTLELSHDFTGGLGQHLKVVLELGELAVLLLCQ